VKTVQTKIKNSGSVKIIEKVTEFKTTNIGNTYMAEKKTVTEKAPKVKMTTVTAPAPVVSSNVVLDKAPSPVTITHDVRMNRYISEKSAQDIGALDAEAK